MGEREHVELLKRGVMVWNNWRKQHPQIQPVLSNTDLQGADLRGAQLRIAYLNETRLNGARLDGAQLTGAHLSGAHLIGADLIGANLAGAYLGSARLSRANLTGARLSNVNLNFSDLTDARLIEADLKDAFLVQANLRRADLSRTNLNRARLSRAQLNEVDLSYADLRGADLREANLTGANLRGTNLSNTNLNGANFLTTRLSETILAGVDLRQIENPDTIQHEGPSHIDINTVHLPGYKTRDNFLRGAGFSDIFIEYYSSLFTKPIQFASCFISYTHKDQILAERLYKDLQEKGVRCWFAPHDLRYGEYFHAVIDEAIHVHEKLLLLLSQDAIQSDWVEREVLTALEREKIQQCDVLFPIRLDESIMRTTQAWAAHIRRSRHIGDFTQWENEAIYKERLVELLRHLKT